MWCGRGVWCVVWWVVVYNIVLSHTVITARSRVLISSHVVSPHTRHASVSSRLLSHTEAVSHLVSCDVVSSDTVSGIWYDAALCLMPRSGVIASHLISALHRGAILCTTLSRTTTPPHHHTTTPPHHHTTIPPYHHLISIS